MKLRFFLCMTGFVSAFSAAYLLTISVIRLQGIEWQHRTTNLIFTLTFIASIMLQGVAWVLVAMSRRLWDGD